MANNLQVDLKVNELSDKMTEMERGLLDIIAMLVVRINNLEDWQGRETGTIINLFEKSEDALKQVGQNITTIQLQNQTMNSARLSALENEVANITQAVSKTLDVLFDELNARSQVVADNPDTSEHWNGGISTWELSQEQIDVVNNYDKTLGSVVGAINKFNGIAAKGLKYLTNLLDLPDVIGFIESVDVYLTGVVKETNSEWNNYTKVQNMRPSESVMSNVRLFNKLAADVMRVKGSLGIENMASTNGMLQSLTLVNTVTDMLIDGEIFQTAYLQYMLSPMDGGLLKFVGKAATKIISRSNYPIEDWGNRIPVHGFVVLTYPLTPEFNLIRKGLQISKSTTKVRRQIIMSVGATETNFTAFQKNTKNFIAWLDRTQTSDDDLIWTTTQINTKSQDVDIKHIDELLTICTVVEQFSIHTDLNMILYFLEQLTKRDSPYHVFNHNCQHVSRELIDWCTVGAVPHWWNDQDSNDALYASLTNKYGIETFYNSSHFIRKFGIKRFGGKRSGIFDYYYNLFITSLPLWLEVLIRPVIIIGSSKSVLKPRCGRRSAF